MVVSIAEECPIDQQENIFLGLLREETSKGPVALFARAIL
jgi:hypothetical protein